jgi:alkyldihydroxyacetonephosphate synthase
MTRRWNGWGERETLYPLPEPAVKYLQTHLGAGKNIPDASLEEVLKSVPDSSLPPHPLISTEKKARIEHARGQSLPDWIEMRSGKISQFPDGVCFPRSDKDVRTLIDFSQDNGIHLIPYGGGTSVLGHINATQEQAPTLTMDLSHLNRMIDLDDNSALATFDAGIRGIALESQLRARGYTLGHFPQSFEFSTLGGWIATRSAGQQSYYYGSIEDLFAGGIIETPIGTLELPVFPASAAGPDLRQIFLGSEGRFGVITRATMQVRRLPQTEGFYAVFFHQWEEGIRATKEITQIGIPVSMLRLSDAQETATTLALSGKGALITWGERTLGLLGFGSERCLLLFGVTGLRRNSGKIRDRVYSLCRAHGGLPVIEAIGDTWRKSRFLTPYLRNTLWEAGYALDTLETAVSWKYVHSLAGEIKSSIQSSFQERNEPVLVFSHLSHFYSDGASIYTTVIFPRSSDPEITLLRWKAFKEPVSQLIISHHGTISHQHGVGRDHAPYLKAEKGPIGYEIISTIRKSLDPKEIMNPGVMLIDD